MMIVAVAEQDCYERSNNTVRDTHRGDRSSNHYLKIDGCCLLCCFCVCRMNIRPLCVCLNNKRVVILLSSSNIMISYDASILVLLSRLFYKIIYKIVYKIVYKTKNDGVSNGNNWSVTVAIVNRILFM